MKNEEETQDNSYFFIRTSNFELRGDAARSNVVIVKREPDMRFEVRSANEE
jgi:hypothetical protein